MFFVDEPPPSSSPRRARMRGGEILQSRKSYAFMLFVYCSSIEIVLDDEVHQNSSPSNESGPSVCSPYANLKFEFDDVNSSDETDLSEEEFSSKDLNDTSPLTFRMPPRPNRSQRRS